MHPLTGILETERATMNDQEEPNRHARRAHFVHTKKLAALRLKLGRLSLLPPLSSLTTYLSISTVKNRQKMVAPAYKAWHKGYITKQQLELIKDSVVK